MHHHHRRKTAEERFNMLARGWLAYPVTPTHHPSTAEERLYTSTHGRFALSRRRATALFHNPVRKAQRSVPGFSSTPTSACRRYATSPPSAVASPHRPPSIGLPHRKKTAEERFNMLARGWLAYPVTPTHHPSTAEERLYKRHPIGLPRDALRHTQRAEPPFPGSPALRLNQLLFSYSITFCALPSTTTT